MKLCILKNNEKFLEVEMYKYRNIYEYKWEKVESAQYAFYVFDNEKKYAVTYNHTAPFAITFDAILEENREAKPITGFSNMNDIMVELNFEEMKFRITKTKFTRLLPEFEMKYKNLAISGTFNNWDKDYNSIKIDEDGKINVLLNLNEGYYEYKYVIDGEYEKGENRKLIVGESGRLFEKGSLGTGTFSFYPIDKTLEIRAVEQYINKISDYEYEFCLRTQMNDVQRAYISIMKDDKETIEELERFADNVKEFDYFKRIVTFEKKKKILDIQYILEDAGKKAFFDGKTLNTKDNKRLIVDTKKDIDVFDVPDWAKEAIWYNIFPDRFYNANPYNDPIFTELGPHSFQKNEMNENFIKDYKWNSESLVKFEKNRWTADYSDRTKWEKTLEKDISYSLKYMRMYGGDLQGIKAKIPYMKELGITAIWLNPVFFSYQNHKYGTNDFRHISPDFGTIRTSGSKHNVFVSPENKTYIDVLGAKSKNNSELELLELNLVGEHRGKNGYLETEDPKTWVWTESDLIMVDLIKELHKNGIRVIFDGVFNHSSERHWAFTQALLEGPDSKYAKWYKFLDFSKRKEIPFNCDEKEAYDIMEYNRQNVSYIGWAGFRTLPEFNSFNEEYKEYIFNITRKWLLGPDNKVNSDFTKDDGIDGFRLDVPNCLENQYFFTEFRKVMKSTKKDSYITAELWGNASAEVNRNKYDAVMNYEWLKTVIGYFVNQSSEYGECYKLKATDFFNELREKRGWYQYQALQAMQNLNGSHDTDRLYSRIINDKLGRNLEENKQLERGYNSIRPDLASNYHPNTTIDWRNSYIKPKDILKLISVFQMTYIGAPMLYYGDELGMWGATDPYCRKPMLWDEYKFDDEKNPSIINWGEVYSQEADLELFAWYKKLIKIRKNNSSLVYGKFKEIYADNIKDVIVYERYNRKESIIVVINNSFYDTEVEFKTYHINKKFMDLLTNNKINTKKDGSMKISIKAKKTYIFKYNKEKDDDK